MAKLLKIAGWGLLVFLSLQIRTRKFESASDGMDVLGFPFVFFAKIGGECSDCKSEVDFDWIFFFLDYLISGLVAGLFLQVFKKKWWSFGLLGMIMCLSALGHGSGKQNPLAGPFQQNESNRTRPSFLSRDFSNFQSPFVGLAESLNFDDRMIFQDSHPDRIRSIQTLLTQYIEFQESTDSEENKKRMEEHLTSLKGIRKYSDFEVLLNVWLYYDPTDFPARDLVFQVLKNSRPYSTEAVRKRMVKRKKWETRESAPFSELGGLLGALRSAPR